MESREGQGDPKTTSEWCLSPEEDLEACEILLTWIATTTGKVLHEVKTGVANIYRRMSNSQGCSYRHWLRWCQRHASYLYLLSPHSRDPERVSVRFFQEAKSIKSLSLDRYNGSDDDLEAANAAAAMFGGTVDSVSYPGEGRLIFNVTTNLGIHLDDTRSDLVAVPPTATGRTRAISRLDSTALSALIWLHSETPASVSKFLIKPESSSHHALDIYVRVLGDRKAMYRRAYANILGYTEGVARRQRLASLRIEIYDRPMTNTGARGVRNMTKPVRIRSKQAQRARLLIGLSWLSGVATIVLSSIYQQKLGTDIPAIAIAVVSLNFIIVTQAVVAQMTPEHTVSEVLLRKLTVAPSRHRTLMLYDGDAEEYLAMIVAKKRPEVLQKQGACFLNGSSEQGNVKLDGVRMNVTIPGLNRNMNRDWVPVVVLVERTEDMNGDDALVAGSPAECTMLDFTRSSTSLLHFIPAENERDTAFTTSMWKSPMKAGGFDTYGFRGYLRAA